MIIWSGFGVLAPIIAIFCLVITQYVAESISSNPDVWSQNPWIAFLSSCIAGLLCFAISKLLNKKQGKVVIMKETGEERLLKPNHSFFFIPLGFYIVIWPVIGLIMMF